MKKYLWATLLFCVCFLIGFMGYSKYYPRSFIPKIIHYVWLGGNPLPTQAQEALASWKKYAPDYKIMRWDESNCDVNANEFIKSSYTQKALSWSSDYCRMVALSQYGGVYLDTDHFLKAPIDPLLKNTRFVATYEHNDSIGSSFIAASRKNKLIKNLLTYYEQNPFYRQPSPFVVTKMARSLYPHILMNGKKVTGTDITLYPANVLMFDFGGGENRAEHLYAASSTELTPGTYYHIFKHIFLQENGLSIHYKGHPDILIPEDDTHVYLLSTKQKARILTQTPDKISIVWENGQKEIFDVNQPSK